MSAGAAAAVGWNLLHGTRLARLPSGSRAYRALAALCAFLVLPSLVIGLLAPTAPGARVLQPLAWLWPLVALAVVAQAVWTLASRRGAWGFVAPVVLLDATVAWIAIARWLESEGAALPAWLLAPGFAVATLAANSIGSAAITWSTALLVPVLAPAAPPRSPGRRVARWLVALGAAAGTAAIGMALPSAYETIAEAQAPDATPLPVARTDLALGVRLFGTLVRTPSAPAVRTDLAVADSLSVTAVHVELSPDGATPAVLDSIARALEPRRDSLALVVTLDLPEGTDAAPAPGESLRARLSLITRITTRLRPDVLVAAERISGDDMGAWQNYYTRSAAAARAVDRGITVALGTTARTAADSTMIDWVLHGGPAVDAVALAVPQAVHAPQQFDAALAALARWASSPTMDAGVWILGVPVAPGLLGERAQQRALHRTLAWSAAHAFVRGVIAGDASDEMAATGLSTANGRPRLAVRELSAALRAQRDAPAAAPTAPPAAPDTARPPADTLSPVPR